MFNFFSSFLEFSPKVVQHFASKWNGSKNTGFKKVKKIKVMDNDDKNYVFTFCIISLEKMTLWRFVTSKFSYCIIFYINIYGYAFGVLRSQIMKIILSRERDLKFILDLPIVQKWIRIFFLRNCLFQKTHFLDKIVSNDYKNIFRLRGKKQFFEFCFELFLCFCF